jgi:hypothetical protein
MLGDFLENTSAPDSFRARLKDAVTAGKFVIDQSSLLIQTADRLENVEKELTDALRAKHELRERYDDIMAVAAGKNPSSYERSGYLIRADQLHPDVQTVRTLKIEHDRHAEKSEATFDRSDYREEQITCGG